MKGDIRQIIESGGHDPTKIFPGGEMVKDQEFLFLSYMLLVLVSSESPLYYSYFCNNINVLYFQLSERGLVETEMGLSFIYIYSKQKHSGDPKINLYSKISHKRCRYTVRGDVPEGARKLAEGFEPFAGC